MAKWAALLAAAALVVYLVTGFFDDLRERYTETGRIEERAKWQEAQLAIINWSDAQRDEERKLAKQAAIGRGKLLDELEKLRNVPEVNCTSVSAQSIGLLNDAARAYNCKHYPDDTCLTP